MSNFAFLESEWPQIYEAAARAEASVYPDPRAACFYARRALELAVKWLYKADTRLTLPYQDNLAALLAEPSFQTVATARIAIKAKLIKDHGNRAVHTQRTITQYDALVACRELFEFAYWLATHYSRDARPAAELKFDAATLPKTSPVPKQTQKKLEEMAAALAEKDESLAAALRDKETLDAEIASLRAEVVAARAANEVAPDTHDYNEAQTRDAFIDLLLKEAGWDVNRPGRDTEYEVHGMPNREGVGYADYVLWGDDVEAAGRGRGEAHPPRCRRGPSAGQTLRRLPGKRIRPAPADLLHERVRPLAVGRCCVSATRSAGLLYPRRARTGDSTPWIAQAPRNCQVRRCNLRPLLPGTGHPQGGRDAGAQAAQGAAGNGHGQRQDAHSNWTVRRLDAGQLGETRALSSRPQRAGETGGERLQEALAGQLAGEPRHRARRGRARLCLHLPNNDGPDRRDEGRATSLWARILRFGGDRRGTPLGLQEVRQSSFGTSIRCWWA